jgi:hypothetical protein
MLQTQKLLSFDISKVTQGIVSYRKMIIDSRNKIISHADKDTLLQGSPLGEHQKEDIVKFFQCLYRYVDEVGNAVGVGPLDFRSTYGSGDVLDLIRHLKSGLTIGASLSAQ